MPYCDPAFWRGGFYCFVFHPNYFQPPHEKGTPNVPHLLLRCLLPCLKKAHVPTIAKDRNSSYPLSFLCSLRLNGLGKVTPHFWEPNRLYGCLAAPATARGRIHILTVWGTCCMIVPWICVHFLCVSVSAVTTCRHLCFVPCFPLAALNILARTLFFPTPPHPPPCVVQQPREIPCVNPCEHQQLCRAHPSQYPTLPKQ